VKLAKGGLLAPVGDSAAMADAIVKLAGDPALQAEFSKNAVAAYETQFTLERMDAAYMKLYSKA